MTIKKHKTLKSKILVGFLMLAVFVLATFCFGFFSFHQLEERLKFTNAFYIPTLKAVNQMENSFFLLESDLDKSFQENLLRPKDGIDGLMKSRAEQLDRLAAGARDSDLQLYSSITELLHSYTDCWNIVEQLYNNWDRKLEFQEDLSRKRTEFRLKLKGMGRDLDREIRLVNLSIQQDLNKIGVLLTLISAFCLMSALVISYWITRSMLPLEKLSAIVKSISESGLSRSRVKELFELPNNSDEIGGLTTEIQKMGSSLLDKNIQLENHRKNLEKTHLELAAQNEELRNTKNRLSHSEKLSIVGRMAAQMAHEIRNPLNALSLHVELLESAKGKSAQESLVNIRREISRLISVTENYLDLSKAKPNSVEGIDVANVIQEVTGLYKPLLSEKGVTLVCDLQPLPLLQGDRNQLLQAFGNLIKNAIESFDGVDLDEKKISVQTSVDRKSNGVQISVADTGAGIPEPMLQQIFSPFVTSKAGGTGLGLAYTKEVIDHFRGEIKVESREGKGTTFTISMPPQLNREVRFEQV